MNMYINMNTNIDRFEDSEYQTEMDINDKYMPLDERDMRLVQIEDAKKKAAETLLEKHFLINEKANTNIYLGGVARKYSQYYNEILKQREDQINALKTLYDHIEDIKDSIEVNGSDKKIRELEREQRIIIREISDLEKKKSMLLNKNTKG